MATSNDKLMLEAAALIAELRAENHQLRQDLTKSRGGDPASVKDAIASVVAKELSARRASRVTKTADASESDHFLSDKIRKRRRDERAATASDVRKAETDLAKLRRKAGL